MCEGSMETNNKVVADDESNCVEVSRQQQQQQQQQQETFRTDPRLQEQRNGDIGDGDESSLKR